jgi:hypothetical protein
MLRCRSGRQTVISDFDETLEPDTLGVVAVPEGAEDARMGRTELAIKLVRRKTRTDIEHLAGGPRGVISLCEQELPEM